VGRFAHPDINTGCVVSGEITRAACRVPPIDFKDAEGS
jgi:hypothetical protein